MTQLEFDQTMNQLRLAETEERQPLVDEINLLNAKKRALGYEMQALQAQLSSVTQRRDALYLQTKQIGRKFYEKKKQLIEQQPKREGVG